MQRTCSTHSKPTSTHYIGRGLRLPRLDSPFPVPPPPRAINNSAVVVFSKTYCPYCKRCKAALSEAGVAYEVLELDVGISEGGGA